ncbi:MAG: GAF domain-containing protein, partial [Chloroflexota bacterium]|nr:GAF domain-containing protein [Chloroflexota bacterium]
MMIRFLRRFSVRQRILTSVAALILVVAVSFIIIVANRQTSENAFQRFVNVDSRIEQLLLKASVYISSSRLNLLRYTEGLVPSSYEALDDLGQAQDLLIRAQQLTTAGPQRASIGIVMSALSQYKTAVVEIETERRSEPGVSTAGLEQDAQRLSQDIGTRIAFIVEEGEQHTAESWAAMLSTSQRRIWGITGLYLLLGGGIAGFALLVERSITKPIIALRGGTEAFGRGELDVALPVEAAIQDELSALTNSFNQMAAQLARSYRTLEDRVATRTAELEKRSIQLEAAAKVARNTASIRDTDALLSSSVQFISEQFGFYHAGIFLVDGRGEYVLLSAASSEGGRQMLARQHKLRVGQGIVGNVVLHNEPRIVLDVGADLDFFNNPDLPETHSEIGLPLSVSGRVLGVLDVQSRERNAFSEEDVNVLQTMTDQLALAIENARLLRSSQEALRDLERVYQEQSQAAWREQMQARTVTYHYAGREVVAEDVPPVMDMPASHNLNMEVFSRGLRLGTLLLQRAAESSPWTAEE